MKKSRIQFMAVVVIGLSIGLLISGCGGQPAAPSDTAGETVGERDTGNVEVQPQQPPSGAGGGDGYDSGAATEEAAAEGPYFPAATPAAVPQIGGEARGDEAAGMGGGSGGPSDASGGDAGAPGYYPQPTMAAPPVVDAQFDEPLQAGEVDDNEEFEKYLQYRLDFQSFLGYPVLDLDVSERHIIQITHEDGLPVLGADVTIYDGQRLVTTLHSPATGRVYFFPRAYGGAQSAQSFEVIIEKDQTSVEFTLTRTMTDALWPVQMDADSTRAPVALDVLFLIDSTGSMQDEIDELKNNILSISAQIAALPSNPDVRFGMVTYRDIGDQYVTRQAPFTRDVQEFQGVLMNLRAAGGQDAPESVNQALYEAINNMSWRGGETVSLIFLVGDAPPHLDYSQDYGYDQSLLQASEMGIKVMPIASRLCQYRDGCASDIRAFQEQAEYIFRQMAQFTGGKYIFLTYEDTPQTSGEPGTESHVSEDQYTVEDLDALVIRLIIEELNALTGAQQQ